jgi:hypothetical protein
MMQFSFCICALVVLCRCSFTAAFCVQPLVAPASSTQQRASTALHAKKKNKGPAKARVRGIPVEINVTMVPTSSLPSYAVAAAPAATKPEAGVQQDSVSSAATTSSSSSSSASVTSAPPDMSVPTIVPRLVILDLDATMW